MPTNLPPEYYKIEAEYRDVSRSKGVIRDRNILNSLLESFKSEITNDDWEFISAVPSPVLGKKGNQEYFLSYERIHS